MLNVTSARNRSPFTATQWQELEHQALIYKYMVSGVPIPPELLYSVKRSLETSLASRVVFPHQPIGWGCFQVGFGRKPDPEPGRCRRTDGKKWRCSKEAYPDSKYCERHMHRGRNRSRKPVELASSTSTATAAAAATSTATSTATMTNPSLSINRDLCTTTNTSPSSSSFSYSSSMEPSEFHPHQNPSHSSLLNPFLYPHSSSSRPLDSGFPVPSTTTHSLFLDSAGSSSHSDKDYRYYHATREGVDERAFFPEASGSVRRFQDSYHQLQGYSSSESQFPSISAETSKHQQQPHCFVLGADFKSSSLDHARSIKLEIKEDETRKPLHHFFGEWTPKNTNDSWLDLASSSKTSHC